MACLHLCLLPASPLKPLGLSLLICKVGTRPFLSNKTSASAGVSWLRATPEPTRDRVMDDIPAPRPTASPKLVFNKPFSN